MCLAAAFDLIQKRFAVEQCRNGSEETYFLFDESFGHTPLFEAISHSTFTPLFCIPLFCSALQCEAIESPFLAAAAPEEQNIARV